MCVRQSCLVFLFGDVIHWGPCLLVFPAGPNGAGFRPSPFMTPLPTSSQSSSSSSDPSSDPGYEYANTPHIIMTYTALLTLSILRDDFSRLDKAGLVRLLRACQRPDGSFGTVPPGSGSTSAPGSVTETESDLRTLYCAFVISSLLDCWDGVDVDRAVRYVKGCRVRVPFFTHISTHLISVLSRHTKAATEFRRGTRLRVSLRPLSSCPRVRVNVTQEEQHTSP